MSRFAPEVEKLLRQVGWYTGRKVSQGKIVSWDAVHPLFPEARRVLEEFAGLYFEGSGSIYNPPLRLSFCIDPVEAHLGESFAEAENDLGCRVYPLGLQDYEISIWEGMRHVRGRDALLLAEDGRVFNYYYSLGLIGETIERTLHNLLAPPNCFYPDDPSN